MAYGLKYFFSFHDNATDKVVLVNIYLQEYAGDTLELIPSESPLIINENNNDDDIFSPIRAREFKIRFVSENLIYPGIEQLLTNDDNDWKIEILLDGILFGYGFLLTDQMTEEWLTDNSYHVIEISATDNLGALKKLALPGFDPTDKKTLYQIVRACLDEAIPDLPINIFDNLYAENFENRDSTTGPYTEYTMQFSATSPDSLFITEIDNIPDIPIGTVVTLVGTEDNDGNFTVTAADNSTDGLWILTVMEAVTTEVLLFGSYPTIGFTVSVPVGTLDSYQQCRVDMRTFVNNLSVFEDCYMVLEKILISRNSVLFQKDGEWVIMRVCELFQHDTIKGTKYTGNDTVAVEWNNQANISQSETTKPVEAFMLKSYTNPLLYNKVIFNYENFDEVFCNQLWKRGAITLDNPTEKEYNVDCWIHLQGGIISTTESSVDFGRRVILDADTLQVSEDYIWLEVEPGSGGESFIKSDYTLVNADNKLNINFSRRVKNDYGGSGVEILARILLYGNDGTYYTLDDDGTWHVSNSTFTFNAKFIEYPYGAEDKHEWVDKDIESGFIPKTGKLYFLFYEDTNGGGADQETHFKDFKITYITYLEGKRFVSVTGDYDKLTIDSNLKDSKDHTVFLSDSTLHLIKGSLYELDGLTLTRLWYEMYDELTLYPIKRWNAIAHYFMSYRNMQKAEGTFYGWVDISTLCKVVFVNGNSFKSFLPLYLKDIDTSKGLFSSTFIEVFRTSDLPYEFTADAEFLPASGIYLFIYIETNYKDILAGDLITISGSVNNDVVDAIVVSVTQESPTRIRVVIDFDIAYAAETTAGVSFSLSRPEGSPEHKFDYIYKNN